MTVRPPPTSKLDLHKAKIDQLLADGVWNAKAIMSEIRAADGQHAVGSDPSVGFFMASIWARAST